MAKQTGWGYAPPSSDRAGCQVQPKHTSSYANLRRNEHRIVYFGYAVGRLTDRAGRRNADGVLVM